MNSSNYVAVKTHIYHCVYDAVRTYIWMNKNNDTIKGIFSEMEGYLHATTLESENWKIESGTKRLYLNFITHVIE